MKEEKNLGFVSSRQKNSLSRHTDPAVLVGFTMERFWDVGLDSDKVDNPVNMRTQNDCRLVKDPTLNENPHMAIRMESKHLGNFPLHEAAEKGKIKELEKLLRTEDPFVQDFQQRTPLHHACGYAYQKKAVKMVDAILKSLMTQMAFQDGRKKRLVDMKDLNGRTGLHIAASNGLPEVVEKLLFSGADVNIRDKNNIEPLELIYSNVPTALKAVYDQAVYCKVGDPNDQNLLLSFDFGAIVGYPEQNADQLVLQSETDLLSYCLQQSEQNRASILLHPVVQTFLHFKWKKIRVLLWLSILYHIIWLLLYTYFIADLFLARCPYKPIIIGADNASECNIGMWWSSLNTELSLLYLVTMTVALKEIYEMYSVPKLKYYFTKFENLGQWLLISVVIVTSIPMFRKDDRGSILMYAWQYQASALGIFLAWSLILSQIGKVPKFGVYIKMLAKVLKSFLKFMITFVSLLVAFMVSFQILMPQKTEFGSLLGFTKVMMMMVGELNYDEVFYSENASTEIPFPNSTKLLYGLFVAIVTIILFNLLIGLTVSDIQGLQSVAKLCSLSSQLEQIYLMENFVLSRKFQDWLKCLNKHHWLRYFLITQQTDDMTKLGVDIHISKIPQELQHSIREIAVPNAVQQSDDDDDGNNETEVDSAASLESIKVVLQEILKQLKRKSLHHVKDDRNK